MPLVSINNLNDSNSWPSAFSKEISFPFESFASLLNDLGVEFEDWFNYWQRKGGVSFVSSNWANNTKLDWIWGLGFPLLTDIKRFAFNQEERIILGLSALPGCGKSRLGKWIEAAGKELNLPINVISLDDFYLPGNELDKAMLGNPWDVPRGLPGSHSMNLLQDTIDNWLKTGILKAPLFDKALRNGRGDRSGWINSKPAILVIEGWFLGCAPLEAYSKKNNYDYKNISPFSPAELEYREHVQLILKQYIPIWKTLKRIWHIKPNEFSFTSKWKEDQENQMYLQRGSSLRGKDLKSFVRMIESSIPQESLLEIDSDVVVKINQSRKITWVGKKNDEIFSYE